MRLFVYLFSCVFSIFLIIIPLHSKNLGLKNCNGNDCFFNATMQCLSHIRPFMDFLEYNEDFRDPKNKGAVQFETYRFLKILQGKEKKLLSEFGSLSDTINKSRNVLAETKEKTIDADLHQKLDLLVL